MLSRYVALNISVLAGLVEDKKRNKMDLNEIINSNLFWAAIGALAAVIAAIFPIAQAINRKWTGGLSRKRVQELAEEGMKKFDYWMNNYNHFDKKTDKRKMLEWLEADSGEKIIGNNYRVFRRMAKLLKNKGYDTTPSPNKSEFLDSVQRANNRKR